MFWQQVHAALGTSLQFTTAYYPQTDGQSERTIQTLEDMLRVCVLDWGQVWPDHLPLVEFSYNNSWHVSIRMAPYEALYGQRCRTPLCWDEPSSASGLALEQIQDDMARVAVIRERMLATQSR